MPLDDVFLEVRMIRVHRGGEHHQVAALGEGVFGGGFAQLNADSGGAKSFQSGAVVGIISRADCPSVEDQFRQSRHSRAPNTDEMHPPARKDSIPGLVGVPLGTNGGVGGRAHL